MKCIDCGAEHGELDDHEGIVRQRIIVRRYEGHDNAPLCDQCAAERAADDDDGGDPEMADSCGYCGGHGMGGVGSCGHCGGSGRAR